MRGRFVMADFNSLARSLVLVGVIWCGAMSASARPPELSLASEGLAGETPGDQAAAVVPADNQKNRDSPLLTLLTPPRKDHDPFAAGPPEPFGRHWLIAPMSDLS